MKIRVIASKPRKSDEKSISHLIGREFEVQDRYGGGFDVKYSNGESDGYFIYEDECEVLEYSESTEQHSEAEAEK